MNIFWITKLTDEKPFRISRLELSKALRSRGHKVTLVMEKSIGEKKSTSEDIIYLPTICKSVLSGLIFGLLLSFYFPFIIRKKKVDVLMIDEASVWLPFALTLKLFDFPLILDIRTMPIENRRPIQFDIALHLSKYIINGFTIITPELEEILRKKYNLQNKKIGIWSSGVSITNFTKPAGITDSIGALRHSKSFTLMYHGAYSPTRGIENLIESIGNLENSLRKEVKLLLVGISPDKIRHLSRLCEKIGVKGQVEFVHHVEYEEIPSYILSSSVGIIPLPPENEWWRVSSPLKTLEYLAMGKPIIATNIPFHQRIFDKGKCGILLNTNNPKALANAIAYLFLNRVKLDEMGKKGREIVEKYHTWDKKALEVEKFINSISESY